MNRGFRIGIDLGGTKIEVIALDPEGAVLMRHRFDSPQGDYGRTLDAIEHAVALAEARIGVPASVGIGTPGALSRFTGCLRNSNSTWLNGQPLLDDVELRLGRPVRIANDANCFALSEAIDGAGAGADVVLGVILGTGTGSGIVAGGRLLTGVNAIAGEWGHNPLPWLQAGDLPPPPCWCGKVGCIENYLSGPGMAWDHLAATGLGLDAAAIAARAVSGDPAATATLDRYVERLARGLAQVINLLDPDVIVLGGGLSKIGMLYDRVPPLWGRHVFCDHVATRLVLNRHGDASGVRGAAWLWNEPGSAS